MKLTSKLTVSLSLVAIVCVAIVRSQSTPQSQASNRLAQLRARLRSGSSSTTTTTTTSTTTTTTTTTEKPKTPNRQQQQVKPRSANNDNSNNNLNSDRNGKLDFVEDELPVDFYELPPEQLDLGMNATGKAPMPVLNVAVLRNGQTIDNEITVHPGTPLEMVIYLDDKSAKVYGLLASYLKVKDETFRLREEVIISNGCSIDSYIFGNFELNPEDQSLRAKFRAFKFPESNFVRFVGTVNVCIKQCAKVDCGSRRKRAAIATKDERNNFASLTVSTVLKIADLPAGFSSQV